jgi:dephospho-CoA kinase
MIVIGLTGSIAMGKSEVAKILAAEGLPLFDADKEVHRLYDSEAGAKLLRDLVPSATIHGKVDRPELSKLILANPRILEEGEKRVHAEIASRRAAFLAKAKSHGHGIAVVDVPLLFEKGGDRDVDVTIVVSAPEVAQRERALARAGMTREKLEMILKRQMPDAEKRSRADFVIENDSTLDDLRTRTLAVVAEIRKQHYA